jgi:soluble lytic murein transglycosylase-like protein
LLATVALGRAGWTGGAVGTSFLGSGIPPVRFPPIGPAGLAQGDAPPFASAIEAVARQVGLDPVLLAAVVEAESSFRSGAVSRAGAKGLMQLMDSTALALGVANPFDPQQNLLGGARFLRGLLDRYGQSLPLALAAYNAGPGAVDRYGGIPPFAETQAYVPRVLANLQRYRATSWGRDRTMAG